MCELVTVGCLSVLRKIIPPFWVSSRFYILKEIELEIAMDTEKEFTLKLIEILAKKDATPEEKKVQALIKSALLSENLFAFIKEVELASQGIGKVRSETVKGLVEYARAHNEAQIRTLYGALDRVEAIVEQENNRLTEAEVMVRGTLSYLGLLQD